jgi:adenylate cyclase
MTAIPDENWVTSKDIMIETGISRATLNNYIKMGLLPHPVVQNPGKQMRGTKHIGYFPKDVILLISQVKQLKQEGKTMDSIVKQLARNTLNQERLRESPEPERELQSTKPINFGQEIASLTGAENRRFSQRTSVEEPAVERKIQNTTLTLTINKLDMPAYLINHNFEVEWVNTEAEGLIFNRSVCSITDLESRNIFKLFFGFEFHSNVTNWKEIIAFHIPYIQSKISKQKLPELYQGISSSEAHFLEDLYEDTNSMENKSIDSRPIHFTAADGSVKYYQVHTMLFREGVFFVYVPANHHTYDIMEYLSRRELVIQELLKQRMPSLVSLCVLVADLQDSVKISAELLPGEYFSLINNLWESLSGCFDNYGGIYGKHVGDGMLYYFIKKPGTDYLMNSIECALELKNAMKKFSSDWKIKKGWIDDMYLNIGINEGQEFFGTIRSAPSVEFTALGDSINYASRLSDFARFGEIWTTKSVIGKLDPEALGRIRFGVTRKIQERTLFTSNAFSRVIDLVDKDDKKYGKFIDIATLPITQIIEKAS